MSETSAPGTPIRRILITRPIEDAEALIRLMRERDIETALDPIVRIVPVELAAPDLAGVQALLFTSSNGVRRFAGLTPERGLPVFAVGDATANAARAAGFQTVESAGGDGHDLMALAAERLDPAKGRLLHPSGEAVAGDLAGDLRAKGFTVDRLVLYRADPVKSFSNHTVNALGGGLIDAVMLFSPRHAKIFTDLVKKAKLTKAMGQVVAICLSPAVAEAAALPFKEKRVAAKPDQASLIALLPHHPSEPVVQAASGMAASGPTTPSDAPVPQADPAPRRGGASIGTALAASAATLVLAGLVLGLTRSQWAPLLAAPADPILAARVDRLEQSLAALPAAAPAPAASSAPAADGSLAPRLDALEHRLGELATAQPTQSAAPAAPAVSEAALQALRDRLDQLDQRLRGAADAATLAALAERTGRMSEQVATWQDRIAKAEQSARQGATDAARRAAQAVAAADLSDAVRSGQAYVDQLRATELLAGADTKLKAALDALRPAAEAGVASLEILKRDFLAAARAAANADFVGGETGWWGKVKGALADLVTVRRTDATRTSDDLDARIARAQARLDFGDLAGALKEIAGIPGFEAWQARAEARIQAERAVSAVTEQALTAVSQGGNG